MEQSKFYQIKNITEQEYTLVGCDGSVITLPIQDVDKSASAFTIQDAKAGDVLVTKNKNIFIFKSISDCTIYDYCGLYFGKFMESPATVNGHAAVQLPTDYIPATKEQRDTLLKAMTDAGYIFDFEKKELKKIEQNMEITDFESALFTAFSDAWQPYLLGEIVNVKQWAKEHSKELLEAAKEELKEQSPAWSEEDDENLNWFEKFFRAESVVAEGKDIPQDRYLWFKNLKDRVQPQPKQEWSEEDEKNINLCIKVIKAIKEGKVILKGSDGSEDELISWFKSLKDRYTWKPSDLQIKALEYYTKGGFVDKEGIFGSELVKLLEELKKL